MWASSFGSHGTPFFLPVLSSIVGCKLATEELTLEEQKRKVGGISAVNIGLSVNTLLAAAKTVIGIVGHSPALLADGINSISDVAYYVVASIFMRLAFKPADKEHPYGHSQLETIAALVIGAFVMTTGIAVFWESVNDVYDLFTGVSKYGGAALIALVVALLTIFIKIGLTLFTQKIGRQTNNPAVLALAYDHRNDIFTATAATLGIGFGRAGLPWIDPLAGALVALVILRTGAKIVRDAASDLMDTVPGQELEEEILRLLKPVVGIRQVEEIKAHRFGPYLVVNLTVGVDGSMTVAEGDRIATRIENILMDNIELMRRVHIHIHPDRH